jgi:hypothetical protein
MLRPTRWSRGPCGCRASRFSNKYLKTEADSEQPNNLLSLAECP